MLITLIAATTVPVTLVQARAHVRAPENGDDDELVNRALHAAIAYAEQKTSLAFAPATYEYRLNEWPCYGYQNGRLTNIIDLPLHPVRDVVEIAYLDENGVEQTIDEANWFWVRTPEGARVRFKSSYSLPTLYEEGDQQVRITFEAGFDDPAESGSGDDPALDLPPTLPIAVLMLTEHFYEHRGIVDAAEHYPLVTAADELLAKLKVYR